MKLVKTALTVLLLFFACIVLRSQAAAEPDLHDWNPEWEYDGGFHWHECKNSDCMITANSMKAGYGAHTYMGGVCTVCGYHSDWGYNIAISEVNLSCSEAVTGQPIGKDIGISTPGYEVVQVNWFPEIKPTFEQRTVYSVYIRLRSTGQYYFNPSQLPVCHVNGKEADGWYTTESGVNFVVRYTFPTTAPCHIFDGIISAKAVGMNRVQIQWAAAAGADGYLVLRDGKQIGFTSGLNSTSYIDNAAKSDEFNYYWVIPYSMNGGYLIKGELSPYTWAIGRTIGKVGNITVKPGVMIAHSMLLDWPAVQGANGYVVLSKTKGNSFFNPVKVQTSVGAIDIVNQKGEVRFYWVYGIYTDKNGKRLCAGPISDYVWGITD